MQFELRRGKRGEMSQGDLFISLCCSAAQLPVHGNPNRSIGANKPLHPSGYAMAPFAKGGWIVLRHHHKKIEIPVSPGRTLLQTPKTKRGFGFLQPPAWSQSS